MDVKKKKNVRKKNSRESVLGGQPVTEFEPLQEGFLEKRSGLVHHWTKLWFRLDAKSIRYWVAKEDVGVKDPKSVLISSLREVITGAETPISIKLLCVQGAGIDLRASNSALAHKWGAALKQAFKTSKDGLSGEAEQIRCGGYLSKRSNGVVKRWQKRHFQVRL
jgi:hypothetical protein